MKSNWPLVKLEKVAELTVGFVGTMAKHYTQDGVTFLRSTNIEPFNIKFDDIKFISSEFNEIISKSQLRGGDVVIVRTGKPGACTVIPEIEGSWNCSDLVIVRPHQEKLDPLYLAAYINLASGTINNQLVGAVQQHFNVASAKKLEIPVPPIEVQRKISSLIGNLNAKISINNKINDNLQHLLRMMFAEMFISNAEEDWPVKKLGDFLSLERGLSYKGKYLSENEGVPMLNLGNILPNSVFREEKLKFYTGEFKPRHVVLPGDIIVANTDLTQAREVLGSAIRVPNLGYSTAICSHHISIVRNCKISNNFILGLLNMPEYRSRVAGYATGTTVLALPNETILNCEFRCPSDDAIQKYDDFADPLYAMMENIRIENHKLVALRDSLLPKLMSGEVDVYDIQI